MKYIFFCVFFIVSLSSYSQSVITGTILDEKNNALPQAVIKVAGTNLATQSDKAGHFSLTYNANRKIQVVISYVGYSNRSLDLEVQDGKKYDLGKIVLISANKDLNEVVVTGKTQVQEKREQPIVVDVLDLTKQQQKSSSIAQLLNLSSGIKVRQSSGLGSETSINVNGMQGKSIKYFRDGISTDYLGRAFNISLLPTSTLDQIEVYKGVLPTELGADALGGAVNVISKKLSGNELNVSYSIGSFGYHEFTAQSFNTISKKFFISTSSYFVRSDNNYKVNARIVNPDTRNFENVKVRRFHDAVQSLYLSGKIGLLPNKVLDKAELEVGVLDFKSDLQHNLYMSKPYGEAGLKESLFQTNLLLAKNIKDKIKLNLFAAYSKENNRLTDTSFNRYNWYGQVEYKSSNRGEINEVETRQLLKYDNYFTRFTGEVALNADHTLQFSHNLQAKNRIGENPPGPKIINTNIDPLTIKATYLKNISGFGIKSTFFNKRLINILTVKSYSIATSGVEMAYSYTAEPTKTSNQQFGFANSLKYMLNDDAFLRLSFERATRIPDADEYFGDGFAIRGNLALVPERSNNLNLGYSVLISKAKRNKIDVNLFFRDQKNMVMLIPFLPFASYDNWASARVKGIEITNSGRIAKGLNYIANITYQDLRRTGIKSASEASLLDSRLPNIPYFFGNASLDYNLNAIFKDEDRLNLYTNYSYTLQYYLFSVPKALEPKGLFSKATIDSDLLIPTQNLIDFGATYSFAKKPLSINLEVNNIMDNDIYDRFKVQRPGRNFKIKLLYKIK